MKKTYIAPKTRAFQVSTQNLMETSVPIIGDGMDGKDALGKEEKASGSGIWDLYN